MKALNGIIGASAGVLKGLFDFIGVPKTIIQTNLESADPLGKMAVPSTKLSKVVVVLGIVKLFSDYIYYYDEEILEEETTLEKWVAAILFASFIALVVFRSYIAFGRDEKAKRFLSGYLLPLLGLGVAGFGIYRAISKKKNDNELGLVILDLTHAIVGMWKFNPIKAALAKDVVDGPPIMLLASGTQMALSGMKFMLLPYRDSGKR